ncbi:MAG: hypothetical protein H0X72_00415 [Acidobacteria bacterium]|jgi:hypothetical protein|nr:hypothetical protein [Acidobacteriota bacterium]
MKKLLALFLGLAFLLTSFAPDAFGQTRRKKKKYRGLATNTAIVGGSTAAGALIGRGRNGALIGAGAGLLYASSRKGTKRRHENSKVRRYSKVGGGTLLGLGTGAAVGDKKGMIVGGLAGAGATYLYTHNGKKYYRAKNGRVYSRR